MSTTCSSTRGPARPPSLVTWPMSTTAASRCLASCTRRWALSRTCTMEPGEDSSSGSATVWMESMTTSPGPSSSSAARMPGSCVSDSSHSPLSERAQAAGPVAHLRRALLGRHVEPAAAAAARAAATCRARVDLPMPGSPPMSVTEPGTSPPPSTRSSSGTPVGIGKPASASTSVMGRATAAGRPCPLTRPEPPARPVGPTSSTSSTRAFQAPQDGHRPAHLGWVAAHSVQRWTTRSRVMAPNLGRGCRGLP